MDGLVSTGNEFPCTILEINSLNQKNFSNYFINILNITVDKPRTYCYSFCDQMTDFKNFSTKPYQQHEYFIPLKHLAAKRFIDLGF